MSAVVSSAISSDTRQIDGRRWVVEAHTLDDGEVWPVQYMAEADADAGDALSRHASEIALQLAAMPAVDPDQSGDQDVSG